ncbi:MAG: carboxylesterase family protein [Deltaproteobacteria bacterium]|nr:carboxylesterase family protein [Deltaproteobacteria bacterium]
MKPAFRSPALVAVVLAAFGATTALAAADPNLVCHKTIVKQLEKYKKTHLKLYRVCLDKQNKGDISGPCLDAVSDAKRGITETKVAAAIAKKCTMTTIAALGYRSDCQYNPSTPGIGGTCPALPVTTPSEFADCMQCWKGAEFARFVGTLYASHAQTTCGLALDDTSATCSAVGCTSPTPDQRDLGDNAENDCQRTRSKAGIGYLLKREKALDTMVRYWTRFARTGKPTAPRAIRWPRFEPNDPAGARFVSLVPPAPVALGEGSFHFDHQCAFWDQLLGN